MGTRARLWLFVLLVLLGFQGPGADSADPGRAASESRESEVPAVAAPCAALPVFPWTPSGDGRGDGRAAPRTIAAAASIAAPPPGGGHSREVDWLNFRRLFADTVSYRTTAPPPRVG